VSVPLGSVLQGGMGKSGNMWLYFLIEAALDLADVRKRSWIQSQPVHAGLKALDMDMKSEADKDELSIEPLGAFAIMRSAFRWRVEDVPAYVEMCTHVWTHSEWCDLSGEVYRLFDKVVYIVRDPRDVAVSLSYHVFSPYNLAQRPCVEANPQQWLDRHFATVLDRWATHVSGHLERADDLGMHVVFYERLRGDFCSEVTALMSYLGFAFAGEQIAGFERATSMDKMREKLPTHVRKGQVGGWRSALSAAQKQAAERRLGPLLEALEYPITESDDTGRLPKRAAPVTVAKAKHASSTVRPWPRRVLRRLAGC
jgi:aryl sulfotransferase